MTRSAAKLSTRSGSDGAGVVQAVTVIMGVVVGLTFLFGFGNVLNLALRLGVPVWVAPLVAPAVDLSILGLLLGIRHLALAGASAEALRPVRRLLIFASVVTLALNVAEPLVAGEYGKAAFDAVGPLLLIGWSEVGPGFLQAIKAVSTQATKYEMSNDGRTTNTVIPTTHTQRNNVRQSLPGEGTTVQQKRKVPRARSAQLPHALLERARHEDAAHRTAHQKPISADTLRARLGIGAERARRLVSIVRSEAKAPVSGNQPHVVATSEVNADEGTLVA